MRRSAINRRLGRAQRRRRAPSRKAEALRSVPGLAALPAPERAALAELFDEVRVPAGAVLAREGRAAAELVLILEGRARALGSGQEAGRPGQFVGALEVVGQADHLATVIAATPMHLLVAGPSTVRTVLDHPAVLRHIVTGLAGRRRDAEPPRALPEPAA